MSIATGFSRLWEEYKQLMAQQDQALVSLRSRENDLLPCEHYSLAIGRDEYHHRRDVEKTASRIFSRMISYAEEKFAPSGGNLSIDGGEVKMALGLDDDPVENLDIEALWNHLEQNYGGTRGEEIAYSQAAAKLVREFSLSQKNNVETKAGKIILNLGVYLDGLDRKWNGASNLSYNSQEGVCKTLLALASFASWAGLGELEGALNGQASSWWRNKRIDSRRRYVISGDMALVTYHNRFEFQFTPTLAEQFQIFIGTFAAGMMKAAA